MKRDFEDSDEPTGLLFRERKFNAPKTRAERKSDCLFKLSQAVQSTRHALARVRQSNKGKFSG